MADYDNNMPPLETMKGNRVALFGSSANPPTLGHYTIVEYLASLPDAFDEIWIMPVYHHIFNKSRKFESYTDRLIMCKNSFELLSSKTCIVRVVPVERIVFESNDCFKNGSARAGTVDILFYLREQYPNVEFTLVLGTDTYNDLVSGKWKRPQDILNMVQILTVSRPGYRYITMPHTLQHKRVVIPHIPSVSSTMISSMDPYQGGASSFFQESVHPEVMEYMKEHQLYGFSPDAVRKRQSRMLVAIACISVFVAFALSRGRRTL